MRQLAFETVEEHRTLGVCHHPTASHVAQAVARAALVHRRPSAAAVQQLHRLVDGVTFARSTQVPAIQAMYPGALVAPVGDQANSDLRDREREGVVRHHSAIAGLGGTVEK
jgi:hypothetical protein